MSSVTVVRTLARRAALLVALIGLSSAAVANPAYYTGGNKDLDAPNLSSIDFNTDTGVLTLGGGATCPGFLNAAPDAEDVGGVMVFRFRSITIRSGVTVTVTGLKPLAIAAQNDFYIGSGISVSGSSAGRAGGGVGGAGGAKGLGGIGGSGATPPVATAGGARGLGGRATGNGSSDNGTGGTNGTSTAGNTGGDAPDLLGVSGPTSGASGSDGGNGFGVTATAPVHGDPVLGLSGAAHGIGGNGGPGGTGGVATGGAGGNGFSNGGDAGTGGSGTAPASAGVIGGAGDDGIAATSGENASFTVAVNTLDLYAGVGGAGGGGGGGAQGGGQGGSGGTGMSGGGGGGGGAGWTITGTLRGGQGTQGGTSGSGGTGGAGGTGGDGGTGGTGGNGGGAIILSARGILDVTAGVNVDISAGLPDNALVAGIGGVTGSNAIDNRTAPTNAAARADVGAPEGPGTGTFGARGGFGGTGGNGGAGGLGGKGGTGGTGGTGGNGGNGTPGMLKLQGSVIRANNMQVVATGGIDSNTEHRGKLTLITNMTTTALAANDPQSLAAPIEQANAVNAAISAFSPYTVNETVPARPLHPLIPQLTDQGPSVEGILQETINEDSVNYFNRSLALAAANVQFLPSGDAINGLRLKRLTGANAVYKVNDGVGDVTFDQVFIVNPTGNTFFNVSLTVGTLNPPVLINTGGVPGVLPGGRTWTTTVPAGAAISLGQAPIVTSPNPVQLFPGGSTSFTVSATSLTPLCTSGGTQFCYQWFTDASGTPLPSGLPTANNATLVLNNVQAGVDNGNYWCVVTNDGGSTESAHVLLSFKPKPQITKYPGCNNVLDLLCENGQIDVIPSFNTQMFITISQFTEGETYQWQRCDEGGDCGDAGVDWVNITNANPDPKVLRFTNVTQADQAFYRVVVTNPSGSDTSTATGVSNTGALLNVLDNANISQDPQNLVVPPNFTPTNFTVSVAGEPPFNYIWQFCPNGGNCPENVDGGDWADLDTFVYPTAGGLTGAATLELGTAQVGEVGLYRCKVNNAIDLTYDISNSALLSLSDPGISVQPQSQVKTPGDTTTFSVVGIGTPPLAYQWYKDNVALTNEPGHLENAQGFFSGSGVISPTITLTIFNTQAADVGSYKVKLTNGGNPTGILSSQASLSLFALPQITQNPASLARQVGDSAVFEVLYTSDLAVTFAWFKDGSTLLSNGGAVSGATSPRLQFSTLTAADEGTYTVVITNAVGDAVSVPATLLVGNVFNLLDCSGGGPAYSLDSRTLSITTSGGKTVLQPRFYQWQKQTGPSTWTNIGSQITGVGDPFTAPLQLNNIGPANVGTYRCKYEDDRSRAAGTPNYSCELTVTVTDHLSLPVIAMNGQTNLNIELIKENPAVFTVNVSGGRTPLSYNWLYSEDGAKSFTTVSTSNTFQIANPQVGSGGGSGEYYLIVGDAGTDQLESNHINLTVVPGLPAASAAALAMLAMSAGAAGALVLRRRRA